MHQEPSTSSQVLGIFAFILVCFIVVTIIKAWDGRKNRRRRDRKKIIIQNRRL